MNSSVDMASLAVRHSADSLHASLIVPPKECRNDYSVTFHPGGKLLPTQLDASSPDVSGKTHRHEKSIDERSFSSSSR